MIADLAKWLLLAVILLLMAANVHAAESVLPGDTVMSMTFTSLQSTPIKVFRMSPGACLRGPLVFKREDGTVIFKLEAGIEFPTGCGKDAK